MSEYYSIIHVTLNTGLPFGSSIAEDPRFTSIPATAGLYRFPIGVGSDILQENVLAVGWSLALLERFTGEYVDLVTLFLF